MVIKSIPVILNSLFSKREKKKKFTFHIKLNENSKEFFSQLKKKSKSKSNQNLWRYVNVGSLIFKAILAQAYFS